MTEISLYYFVGGILLLMIALGLWFAVVMPDIEQWSRRYFITFFSLLMLCVGFYVADGIVFLKLNHAVLARIIVFIEYFITSVLIPMPTIYLLHCCGEDRKRSRLLRLILGLWCVYFILLVIGQFTSWFYYITPDTRFYRDSRHPLLMMPMILIQTLTLAAVIRRRKMLSRKNLFAFLICLIPMTGAMIAHTIIFFPLFIDIGFTFCALSMFSIILFDQIEKSMRQQREISNQRASIMVLQMRPHFIYNTLLSIYYLCEQDTKKAQQVILDFSSYLRQNFTALSKEELIPFSEELEHTRAYLAVEQVRFEDLLFVEFDTPFTRFRLPPLTVQPIVENAVKHGVDPELGPLKITVQSRETASGSMVIVTDNGPGYAPSVDDEPHIALRNIGERLKLMCGGSLEIRPGETGGTVVTIEIPDKAQ